MTRRKTLFRYMLFAIPFLLIPALWAQGGGNVVRMVTWEPKPGMDQEMEAGYKRHLQWHKKNNDTWRWYGWNVISGERDGFFIDGTCFHQWADFDSPVSPAADAADNAVNVVPYGTVRQVATYEVVEKLSNTNKQLSSPLLTFCRFSVAPGRDREFESILAESMHEQPYSQKYLLLRPINGSSEYLLLLTATKLSQLGTQAEFTSHLLESLAGKTRTTPLLNHFHTETARYREDLSYAEEGGNRE